jgi:hypothetical protein
MQVALKLAWLCRVQFRPEHSLSIKADAPCPSAKHSTFFVPVAGQAGACAPNRKDIST